VPRNDDERARENTEKGKNPDGKQEFERIFKGIEDAKIAMEYAIAGSLNTRFSKA